MKDTLVNKIHIVVKNNVYSGNLETKLKAFFKKEDAEKEFQRLTEKELKTNISNRYKVEKGEDSFFMYDDGNACWDSLDIHIETIDIQQASNDAKIS